MAIPAKFANLKLPVIAAPMFLASGPELVIETAKAGMIGAFPALNQWTSDEFADWLTRIRRELGGDEALFGVNLVVRDGNPRLHDDLEKIVAARVPLVITSLGLSRDVIDAVHSYGGLVFHDVVQSRHAQKAVEAGVDGIIAVCAGAGGHSGANSPFALLPEIRSFFNGPLVLGGSISTGAQIAAARMMGADMAYMGTRFLATQESIAQEAHKQMIVASSAKDVIFTPSISGVNANFLAPSIAGHGLDPKTLPARDKVQLPKGVDPWAHVWSAGQGIGSIQDVPTVAELGQRLEAEYNAAVQSLSGDRFAQRRECVDA